jgi:hypothetical protein
MCGSTRYASNSRYGLQRLILLKVRLEQTEPIQRQSPGLFRESRERNPYSTNMPNNVDDFMPNNSEMTRFSRLWAGTSNTTTAAIETLFKKSGDLIMPARSKCSIKVSVV